MYKESRRVFSLAIAEQNPHDGSMFIYLQANQSSLIANEAWITWIAWVPMSQSSVNHAQADVPVCRTLLAAISSRGLQVQCTVPRIRVRPIPPVYAVLCHARYQPRGQGPKQGVIRCREREGSHHGNRLYVCSTSLQSGPVWPAVSRRLAAPELRRST